MFVSVCEFLLVFVVIFLSACVFVSSLCAFLMFSCIFVLFLFVGFRSFFFADIRFRMF